MVALREIWDFRIWYARPAIVVEDGPDRTLLYVPAGVSSQAPVDEQGQELRIYQRSWRLAKIQRGANWLLSFAFPRTPYAVILGFDSATDQLLEYYINLQAPLARTAVGFDTVEFLLDAEIPADRSDWGWKDEDELSEAVALGLFSAEEAAWFHHWGERAAEHVLLRVPPFDEDWSVWRPDPSWPAPELPDGWDAPVLGSDSQQT